MFYSCDEGPNENVDHWVYILRQLSKSCNFEAMTDSLLRDWIVLGTKDKATRAWMFREKVDNLNKAVDILRASEAKLKSAYNSLIFEKCCLSSKP